MRVFVFNVILGLESWVIKKRLGELGLFFCFNDCRFDCIIYIFLEYVIIIFKIVKDEKWLWKRKRNDKM